MKTFVVGDIHGAFKALKQCLERSEFDYTSDRLIVLGDIVDGWPEVYESIEELLKINNLIVIRGNHDDWFRAFLTKGFHPVNWLQGGEGTLESYCKHLGCEMFPQTGGYRTTLNNAIIPNSHIDFYINKQIPYFIDEGNNCFVHGGFNRAFSITNTAINDEEELMWNRNLFSKALSHADEQHKFKIYDEFNEIFIGHTPTLNWGTNTPMKAANIWNLDTGAGYNGKLTIMNVETKEYWQSDLVTELYKGKKGRN